MEKGNSSKASFGVDPPTYDFDEMNAAVPEVEDEPRPRPSKKVSYALTLQRACEVAFRRVKNNNVVAHSQWAAPLATAPSAISTMAILLKAADNPNAAGLEIESQDVKLSDGTVVGTLPSKYFHTNLQHCSDVGRLAFLDAQNGMSSIRATARSMISEQGSIAYIIDLLEDPEDARYNLKPEIAALKKTASKCLATATSITTKFEYWYQVIIHLKQTSLSKGEKIIKEKDVTKSKKLDAKHDEDKYIKQQQALEENITIIKKKLAAAEKEVEKAESEVDRLRYAPIIPEPYVLDEIEKIRRSLPIGGPQYKDRGMLVDFKDALWGKSKEHESQDEAVRIAHLKRVQQLQDEALQQARNQRAHQRKVAADNLNAARNLQDKTTATLNETYNELNDSSYQLAKAKANLVKAKGELELLSNKEIELEGIMQILDNSTKNLGKLKEQIEPLVVFFRDILGEVDHAVDDNLQAFLRPIVNGITEGSNPEEVEAINLSRRSKEKMISTALQMQGRFSAIADISNAYITVSTSYIRPAINKMEILSTLDDSEWAVRGKEFIQECENLMADIDGIAQETNANMDKNINRHIKALQVRAIEAANENEERD